MELTLEIEDGHKYNHLVQEIEDKYFYYLENAENYFKKKEYEKSLKFYDLCIKLDSDNTHHIKIMYKFKYLINELLKKYIDCSYHSFTKGKYHVSIYYIIKSLCLMDLFDDNIKKSNKRFNNILSKRLDYINSLNYENVNCIHKNDLYKIRIN